jgi:gliding motility-associated-like protein
MNLKLVLLCFFMLILQASTKAQLIQGYDTACVNNKVQFTTRDTTSSTRYWGFCSAYLNNVPTGTSIASGTGLSTPQGITLAKDGNNFYVFVLNSGNPRDIIRYDFGTSLSNAPVATNIGNMGGSIPSTPKGFQIVQENGNFYGFITGGGGLNSSFVRLDFGTSLNNIPTATVTDLDVQGLTGPQDLYIFKEAGEWYGITNSNFGRFYIIKIGAVITNPPVVQLPDLTLTPAMNVGELPVGFWPILDENTNNWHIFLVTRVPGTDTTNSRVRRLDFGNSLLNNPAYFTWPNTSATLNTARDITIIKDCGNYYGYVTNEGDNTVSLFTFNNDITSIPTATNLGNIGNLNAPRFITRFIRDKDFVYGYTTNSANNTLTRFEFNSCSASSIPSSTSLIPPEVSYSSPGFYNVYYVGDEGLPTMKFDCKQILVINVPKIEINNDTTICQGDKILLVANSNANPRVTWKPLYNSDPSGEQADTTSIFVNPLETYTYNCTLNFGGACKVDTSVTVTVSRVLADAGKDVSVADGAFTKLGGPLTTFGAEYSYLWTPATFLNNNLLAEPTCTPKPILSSSIQNPYDQYYYFEVTNTLSGCKSFDTVIVTNTCTDFNLPNAFNPASDAPRNRFFGLLNRSISKLEYFRIFNRWGQLVFETTNPIKQWDGFYNNIPMPSDNYVWIVDGFCENGKRFKKSGNVLLVR